MDVAAARTTILCFRRVNLCRETTTLRTKCSTSLAMVTLAEVWSSTGAQERVSGMACSLPLRHTVLSVYMESLDFKR